MTDTTDIKALSYARLIEVRNILSGFEDGYDTVADKENYEAMRDAQALIDELISARRCLVTVTTKLEAERQRADNSSFRENHLNDMLNDKIQQNVDLRAELAALKGDQVPYAWVRISQNGTRNYTSFSPRPRKGNGDAIPLFTAPQKPVVLLPVAEYYPIAWAAASVLADVKAAIEAAGGIVKDGE